MELDLELDVQYGLDGEDLPGEAEFSQWARAALSGRRERVQLSVRLVDAEEGAYLNRTFRGKSGPTNVLAFPYTALPGVDLPLLGDLALCAPVVRSEALEQGKAAHAHWAHLVTHGILHLLGYEHRNEEEAREMESLEIEILSRLGIADPYRSRDAS